VDIQKSNVLLWATGTGKTLLGQTLANMLESIAIADATTQTEADYWGKMLKTFSSPMPGARNTMYSRAQREYIYDRDSIRIAQKERKPLHHHGTFGRRVQQAL
jgi:ATP-dependent protease Clp ATPase subunit